jgi:hypothetical protein
VQQEVHQVINELSEKDRCLMKALFLEERDKDEVCRYFGVSREYLRGLVHRTRQSLKSRHRNKCGMQSPVLTMSSRSRWRTVGTEALVQVGTAYARAELRIADWLSPH